MKTRAQIWSKSAHHAVENAFNLDGSEKYNTCCNKMPGLIHQAGLLQSLVFMCARDEHGVRYVNDLATAWNQGPLSHVELIEKAQKAHVSEYLAMSRDLATIAHWFRRFAQIQGNDGGAS